METMNTMKEVLLIEKHLPLQEAISSYLTKALWHHVIVVDSLEYASQIITNAESLHVLVTELRIDWLAGETTGLDAAKLFKEKFPKGKAYEISLFQLQEQRLLEMQSPLQKEYDEFFDYSNIFQRLKVLLWKVA